MTKLPDDMYGRSVADYDNIRNFTRAIDRRNGRATLEKILIEVSEIGGDEIEAMITLVESDATQFERIRDITDHALSEKIEEYQKTIRITRDNGWIITDRTDDMEFVLTGDGYEELPWL